MKSRSIKTVILSILAIAVVAVSITASFTLFTLNRNLDQFSLLLDNEIRAERSVERINVEFKRQVQEWKNVLLRGHDKEQRDKYWNRFLKQENVIQSLAADTIPLLDQQPSLQQQVQRFVAAHQEMGQAYRIGFQAFVDADFSHTVGDKAVKGIDREPSQLLEETSDAISQLAIENSSQLSTGSAQLLKITMMILVGIGILILLGAAAIMSRVIIDPLIKTAEQIDQLSHGNFDVNVDDKAQGEIGSLNQSIAALSKQLTVLMGTMSQTASNLQSTAQTMAEHASQQADVSLTQKEHSEQAAAAVEEMAYSAGLVSNSAELTATATENTRSSASQGLTQMQQVSTLIHHLKSDMADAGAAVTELSDQAARVNEVMTVIRSIAEQTNLLALNAAIEAARAGEHGRGFAVVADEVRALAQKTQSSTEEIEEILAAVKQGSESSVATMSQGSSRTDEVVTHIDNLAERWGILANDITQVRDQNAEVATAATEQSTVTSDIARIISGLHESAEEQQKQSIAGQEVSHSLATLADELTTKISQFSR
ncbi:methyl-accepting chemotaxis protein [Thaumasiovibrio subtropicus]|uniref:methyl-accepting chemotaxis protein n=1 Tax=Thaumasiovibrio subtropicus TaxID=1891207 RepID=UPI00131ADFC4|nr:methyl-accepting chemotaxis protein [Thaumasiovibrio subtropicus]